MRARFLRANRRSLRTGASHWFLSAGNRFSSCGVSNRSHGCRISRWEPRERNYSLSSGGYDFRRCRFGRSFGRRWKGFRCGCIRRPMNGSRVYWFIRRGRINRFFSNGFNRLSERLHQGGRRLCHDLQCRWITLSYRRGQC